MRTSLMKGEQILFETRRHWAVLILPATVALIVLAILIRVEFSDYANKVIAKGLLIVLLICVVYFIYKFMERRNDIWVVTNFRVIDESGLFSLASNESPLNAINNVEYDQSAIGNLFRFGDVEVQTAAKAGATTIKFLENPRRFKDTIIQAQRDYNEQEMNRQATKIASAMGGVKSSLGDVAAELEKLFELKQKGILTEDEFNRRKTRLLES